MLAIYLILAAITVAVLGPDRLAASPAPLAEVVEVAGLSGLDWAVRAGTGIAVTGVLLALLAGVARTALAMARRRDLPAAFDAVHPRYRVPHRAELAIAVLVVALVSLGDLRDAIGFSSFTVLVYYALTNASALTLGRADRGWPAWQALAVLGLLGCLILAATLPVASVLAGLAVLAAGSAGYAARQLLRGKAGAGAMTG